MEHNFEDYIKKQVDDYRMYPSQKAWTGIHRHFHGKQGLTTSVVVALLLLLGVLGIQQLTGYTTRTIINAGTTAYTSNKYPTQPTVAYAQPLATNNYALSNHSTIMPANPYNTWPKQVADSTVMISNSNAAKTAVITHNNTPHTHRKYEDVTINTNHNAHTYATITAKHKKKADHSIHVATNHNVNLNHVPTILYNKEENNTINETTHIVTGATNVQQKEVTETPTNELLISNSLPLHTQIINQAPSPIVISPKRVKPRLQVYATPSISYRTLTDKRVPNTTTGIGNATLDRSVYHKPDVGGELGVNWLFTLSSKLRAKAGTQFNYNRYNIKAYTTTTQVVDLALTGNNNNLQSLSNLGNGTGNGFFPKWVENTNLQISFPIAVEYIVSANDNIQLSLATGLQPSFLLKNKMYLLSTDLQKYTEAPSLVRRVNLQANIEALISVKNKSLTWQLGPQLRYQLLSTYSGKYPFKENIIDYGFKVGVSKALY